MADEQKEHKEPSLAPACLVIVILGLATFSAVCGIGSWLYFGDQYPIAVKAVNSQLIPWIESSQLADEDKSGIIAELNRVLPMVEERKIDNQQLTRLRNCLMDNPVLLWGCVDSIIELAPEAGLTEVEQEALQRVSQRLLRSAAERKLSRGDLEFTLQSCSKVRDDGQSVEVVGPLDVKQIREFMKRAEQRLDNLEIPNEPYEKSPTDAFKTLIEKALTLPGK